MEPNKNPKPKKKFSILRVFLVLGAIFATLALAVFLYVLYTRTFGENEYCQYMRKKENIGLDYNCTAGQEYYENGKWTIAVKFDRPFGEIWDETTYILDKNTKETVDAYRPS